MNVRNAIQTLCVSVVIANVRQGILETDMNV